MNTTEIIILCIIMDLMLYILLDKTFKDEFGRPWLIGMTAVVSIMLVIFILLEVVK